ncbi:DNA-processing protein DprA [Nocardioides eburneiflavus]|uniref:DNA-processing protein DprA n=1 Tax=Nocardioides eburneiflavus TaxID=2518372 RepID=A0A4Z1CA20_9ACTN|nr:DNA-processing protein DprA [Nocardioides eburneiflavus]TGN64236.1 DNA-processing protein DprA [Nocardioides eburneiflavus]
MTTLEEHASLVALLRTVDKGQRWASVTEAVLERGSATDVWNDKAGDTLLPDPTLTSAYDTAAADVIEWSGATYRMIGILDSDYPARLREIHQAPPFLFAAGALIADDPAIAVVGSRKASARGLSIASAIATALAGEGVTVLSGLAAGIDAAAHTAALSAGGRTVAVIATGITKQYPASNRELQLEIERKGLVLSQFWPDAPPQKHNFLMRNAVMSGYGRATVVVEAGEQSGARAQARMAVEHGRPVILTNQVVEANEWAKALISRPGVHVANGIDEAMQHIHRVLDRDNKVDRLLDDLLGAGL